MGFDPSTFNWSALLLTISGVLITSWALAGWRWSSKPQDIFISFAFILTACKSAAAPFRGLLDPDYIGFGFGLLQAEQGWPVTLAAGSVVGFGAAAGFAALKADRAPTIFAGAVGLVFLALQLPFFLPLLLQRPEVITMQFGEYLTIPPTGAIPIGLYMVLGYTVVVGRAVRATVITARQRLTAA